MKTNFQESVRQDLFLFVNTSIMTICDLCDRTFVGFCSSVGEVPDWDTPSNVRKSDVQVQVQLARSNFFQKFTFSFYYQISVTVESVA